MRDSHAAGEMVQPFFWHRAVKNRTVSRERILNEIWGQDYFGDIRTVDVRIANLRKKLNLSEEIRTISKAGYRLEER